MASMHALVMPPLAFAILRIVMGAATLLVALRFLGRYAWTRRPLFWLAVAYLCAELYMFSKMLFTGATLEDSIWYVAEFGMLVVAAWLLRSRWIGSYLGS